MNIEEATVTILAGLVSNPAIIAPNDRCGWSLVNCSDEDLVGYANHLAEIALKVHPDRRKWKGKGK